MKNLLQALSENVSFVLTCLAIFAALLLIAILVERALGSRVHRITKTRYIAFVSMSAALAGVLMSLEFPIFFIPSFYQLDLSEIPAMICSFYLGPVAGVLTELVKVVVKLLIKGTSTAFVGDFANFCVGCAFVIPACILYHLKKSKKMALISMGAGTAVMTVFGSILNAVYLLPKFVVIFGMPMEAIISMAQSVNSSITSVTSLVLLAVVPFNLLKGLIVSVVTFLLYKRVERVLGRLMSN